MMSAPAGNRPVLKARSFGAKFFIIAALALVMSMAGFFVESLVGERASSHGVLAAAQETPTAQASTVLGVRLADSYRATYRSLHYITLFLGLVFLTYFLLEVLSGKVVHPAQYALAGIAQILFYLLLLSLAEHIGFDLSFAIAGGSTVALLSMNTEWIFRSRRLALRALAALSTLYTAIYVLLRIETYALLMGAILSFVAVAAAMYCTRNIDWYGGAAGVTAGAHPASAAPARESWLD